MKTEVFANWSRLQPVYLTTAVIADGEDVDTQIHVI